MTTLGIVLAVVVGIGVVAVVGASIAIFRLIDLLDDVPLALMLCLRLMVKRRFLFRVVPR
jgi:multisubunit Na+/H+ antiporter MnhG subunit